MILSVLLLFSIGVTDFVEAENLIRVRRWKGDSGGGGGGGDDQSNLFRGTAGVDYPNFKTIPVTSFKCSDYPYPAGLYADVEAQCQVYHVCHEGRKESFLCGKGTIFNQQILTCDYWYSTECDKAPNYYYLNEQIGDIQTRLQGATFPQGTGPGYSISQTSRLNAGNQGGTNQYKIGTNVGSNEKRTQDGSSYKPQKTGPFQPDKLPGGSGEHQQGSLPGDLGQYNPQVLPGDSGQYNPHVLPGDSGQYNPQALPGDSGQYYPQNLPGDSGQYYPQNLPGDSGQYYEGRTSSVTGHQFKGAGYVPGRSPSGSAGPGSIGQTRPGNLRPTGQIAPGGHIPAGQIGPGSQSLIGQAIQGPGGQGYIRQTRPGVPDHIGQTGPGGQGYVRQTIPGSHTPTGQATSGSHSPAGQNIPGNQGQYQLGSRTTNKPCQGNAPGAGGQCQPDGQDIYIIAVLSGSGQTSADGQKPGTKGNIYSDHYPKPPGSKFDKGPNPTGSQYLQPQGSPYRSGSPSGFASGTSSSGGTQGQRPQSGPWSFPSGGMMMMGGPGDR